MHTMKLLKSSNSNLFITPLSFSSPSPNITIESSTNRCELYKEGNQLFLVADRGRNPTLDIKISEDGIQKYHFKKSNKEMVDDISEVATKIATMKGVDPMEEIRNFSKTVNDNINESNYKTLVDIIRAGNFIKNVKEEDRDFRLCAYLEYNFSACDHNIFQNRLDEFLKVAQKDWNQPNSTQPTKEHKENKKISSPVVTDVASSVQTSNVSKKSDAAPGANTDKAPIIEKTELTTQKGENGNEIKKGDKTEEQKDDETKKPDTTEIKGPDTTETGEQATTETEKPEGENAVTDTTETEKPEGENAVTDTTETEKPEGENAVTDTTESKEPEGENAVTDPTETEKPEGENAVTDTTEEEKPVQTEETADKDTDAKKPEQQDGTESKEQDGTESKEPAVAKTEEPEGENTETVPAESKEPEGENAVTDTTETEKPEGENAVTDPTESKEQEGENTETVPAEEEKPVQTEETVDKDTAPAEEEKTEEAVDKEKPPDTDETKKEGGETDENDKKTYYYY